MNVELKLNNWKVRLKDGQKTPTVVGKYDVIMGGAVIASQSFNDGYDCKEIAFSGDVLHKIIEAEKLIVEEIQKIIC